MQNPSSVIFSLWGRDIYWYGVLMAIAIIVGVLLASREANRKGINPDSIIDYALLAVPLGLIFARLYYVVFEWEAFASNPIKILYVWEGGLAIYGAVIGGIIAALIFCKWKKISLFVLLDILIPSLLLGQAIGRWGNFFNQEAYGPIVTNPAWQWFPFAVKIEATSTIHYATFFYESMWCLLVFLFLMWRRKKFKHNGDVFLWGVMLYTFERAFIESLRQDSLWLIPDKIRVSQLVSAVLFILILTFFIIRYFKEKKNGMVYCPVVDNGPYFSPDALRAHKHKSDKPVKSEETGESDDKAVNETTDEPADDTSTSESTVNEQQKAEESEPADKAEDTPEQERKD
jgi:phosphatidylglycerol:prolipoprotein diacylglycerol transferase